MLSEENVLVRENPSDCVVAIIPSKTKDLNEDKLRIYAMLWENNIQCDLNYKLGWNLGK